MGGKETGLSKRSGFVFRAQQKPQLTGRSHGGWNSPLELICFGAEWAFIPSCWPLLARKTPLGGGGTLGEQFSFDGGYPSN